MTENKKKERKHRREKPYVTFGPLHSGEEQQIIECIRDEYGDTYFRRDFYEESFIRSADTSGKIRFLTAREGERLAGMIVLIPSGAEGDKVELASGIVRREYRGFGLSGELIGYAMESARKTGYTVFYSLPVTFHMISQKLLSRMGFQAAGFLPSVFYMPGMRQSYGKPGCERQGQGVQVMSCIGRDVGNLWPPEIVSDFVKKKYDRLGSKYRLCCPQSKNRLSGETQFVCQTQERQKSLTVRIDRAGSDLGIHMQRLCRTAGQKGFSFTARINMNHESCPAAYRELERMDFLFTGLQPLYKEQEYLIMHADRNGTEREICSYVLDEEFTQLREELWRLWESGGGM